MRKINPLAQKTPDERREETARGVAPKLANVAQHWLERQNVRLSVEETYALHQDMVTAVASVLKSAQPRLDREAAERAARNGALMREANDARRLAQESRRARGEEIGKAYQANATLDAFQAVRQKQIAERREAIQAELARRKQLAADQAGIGDLV